MRIAAGEGLSLEVGLENIAAKASLPALRDGVISFEEPKMPQTQAIQLRTLQPLVDLVRNLAK
jgi:hypothetical protein